MSVNNLELLDEDCSALVEEDNDEPLNEGFIMAIPVINVNVEVA